MKFHLETGRLRIRSFQDSDLESFYAYRNDPEVARYQGWDVPYPWEKALAFVEGMKTADPRTNDEWFQAANVPSFRLLERLGFRREAHFVENVMFKGAWGSEYSYGMLKREWEISFA